MKHNEVFRNRLLQLRENAKLTQLELSKKSGVSRTCIRGLEAGVSGPRADSLVKLADYFQVTTDYLLGREKEETIILQNVPTQISRDLRTLIQDMEELWDHEGSS